MGKSIDQLLAEADSIIEKKASEAGIQKTAEDSFSGAGDDIEKFASYLEQEADAGVVEKAFELTPLEKAAHAVAMVETILNLSEFEKLAQFEEKAREQGYSDQQIQEFLDKQAAFNVHKHITLPGALMATGAAVGGHIGNKKGKEKGYKKALNDVNEAFSQHAVQG